MLLLGKEPWGAGQLLKNRSIIHVGISSMSTLLIIESTAAIVTPCSQSH
jgi:hypothetical protein